MKKFGFVLRTLSAKAVASTFAVLLAQTAWAHPHEWIDLTVQFKFDEEKRLIALEQSWLFDPFFSAYVLDELTAEIWDRVLETNHKLLNDKIWLNTKYKKKLSIEEIISTL